MNARHTLSSQQRLAEAQQLERQGRTSEAEAVYRAILQADPGFHPAFHALGLLYFNAGNLPLAADMLKAAAALDKKNPLYQRNYGEMCRRLGRLDDAIAAGKAACKLSPSDIDAHYNLGLAYTDARQYQPAIESYRRALKLDAGHNLSWNNLGSALEQQGDKSAALEAYEKAVAIDPRHAEAQNNTGAIYSEQGKLDQARAAFQAAIDARPDFVEAHYNLSSLKKYSKDDPHLAMLERVYASRHQLSPHARIRYAFALGKALDDIGDYDRAFTAYDEGNRLQHASLPCDEAGADAMLAEILRVFDEKFFTDRKGWQGAGDSQHVPIFIVGMPRSGTTLLEQILCSHASVHGAGELVELNQSICEATGARPGRPFTQAVTLLDETEVRRIGEAYLRKVWKLSPESRYITDKMPANFFYLGLIHLALPHARIIHAMRDPMDSCFSCYSRLFNDTMEFAYDQGTLGRYYARYMTLMRHWHRVLPPGTILDLPYEKMVADTEGQARRVLEFVGLPWDPNCLEFHKNDRLVRTASVAQVRKPIYKTSVARWKHFATHLKPLYAQVRAWRDADPETDLLMAIAEAPVATTEIRSGQPAPADQLHTQGIARYRAGRIDEALEYYERALALQPDFAAALNSKGFALQDLDRLEEALACFARAVALAPGMDMARLNLGMAQLKLGDWERGWENYEARWTGSAEAGSGNLNKPACPLPTWNGASDTQGKRLLVLTEQGFGDTFQFARYLPLAAERFAKVGFVCSQPTMRLMEWSYGDRIVAMSRMPADFEAWDLQCHLMSLPRAFGTRPDSIPAAMPALRVPSPAAAHWRERLELAAPGRFRVGIAWAGRKAHQYDARRSLRFEQLLPLLGDPRITWVSLQKWAPEDTRPAIPAGIDWLDWTEELTDFADTAALLSHLDLVVSIDSSMVHLAGSLNKPVWMMNRFDGEWRWLRRRDDSPWYPSLRIFNQPAFGDWASVIETAQRSLEALPMPATAPRKKPAQAAVMQQIASTNPVAATVPQAQQLHQQGINAWQAGRSAEALRLIQQAISLDATAALFHSNLAEMHRQLGKTDEAIRHGEQAVALDPAMASAHSNLGIAYYDAKDYERAEACHQRALALAPQLLQTLNNLGSIERARKDLNAAADWYRRALAVNGDFLESLSNLGAVLVEDDQADAAEPPLVSALQLQPAYPEALCNLGLVRLKQERVEEGLTLLQRALQLRPGYPEALVGLARGLHELDRLPEAKACLQQAVETSPDKTDAWCQLATVRMALGETDEAETAYQKALVLEPASADALTGLGNLRLEQGKIDASVQLLEQALEIDADNLGARFHLSQARKVKPGDPNLAALEARLSDAGSLNTEKRISLHYALGKSYDDLKEWDKAFPHFLEGARLKRGKLDYDAEFDAARLRRIADVVDRKFIDRLWQAGDSSEVPVFVLGMPRSGTTLTEQIIASHPEVFGAGELRDLMEVVQQPTAPGDYPGFPDNLLHLDPATAAAWGAGYVDRLRKRAPQAARITDKMPANYMAMGLIPLILPQAKIVHVRRNPVDTCLSCFTRLFNRHQDATYDLYELGRHYANYARLMNHWRDVLPQGSFIEVQYEAVVDDLEGQARRLIDWVGLPWDEACLAFHENKRSIRTASVTQVRQPIYTSSVERWRNYEKYLGPLLEGLGEFRPG